MDFDHDPVLQSSYVRQCLAQEKRPIGFFLGAGCPMAIRVNRGGSDQPLIPDIAGITALVDSELRASKLKAPFEGLLNHFTVDGRSAPNIEDLLSHIRSLNAVAGKDSVRGLSHVELSDLDAAICEIVVRVAS